MRMDTDELETDILLVGAGPVGLYGAYYAGFRGLRVTLIDSLEEPGGQVTALYPEKAILDVAGFPSIRGRDLVTNLVEQAGAFHPTYLLGEQAQQFAADDDGVVVTTDRGRAVRARAVVITGGIGTFSPRPLPAGGDYEGRGLAFYVPTFDDYIDRDVVVVGGGDSALDWALGLESIARSVTLVHRREGFRAHEHSVAQLRASTCDVITNAQVSGVRGQDWVEAVEIAMKDGGARTLKAQALIAALGFTADITVLEGWGLEVRKRRILVDTTMATNLPRVFAAGDIVDYTGKVSLISVGFGEVATAVNNAATVIQPGAKLFPGHSSDPG